jgi:hypothetical protein
MKLNPPASSSDIETARQIARRLHHARRQEDRLVASALAEEVPETQQRPKLTPPPLPTRPAAPEPAPKRAEAPEPPRARSEPKPQARPAPPPAPDPDFETDEVEVDAGPAFAAVDPEPEPLEELASPPIPQFRAASQPSFAAEPEMADVDVDLDAPAVSPEEMIGGAVDSDVSPLDGLTDSESSPFDDELLDAPAVAEEAVGPSWEDIIESCRTIAQARGAMLVDPAGQIFAARGDWPPPGPEAIASKLVAMMAKTLKDAPTRSISAPLMGMHLTAWRVPLSEGLVTVAFIGPAAVRADSRPAIDAEIASGVR